MSDLIYFGLISILGEKGVDCLLHYMLFIVISLRPRSRVTNVTDGLQKSCLRYINQFFCHK